MVFFWGGEIDRFGEKLKKKKNGSSRMAANVISWQLKLKTVSVMPTEYIFTLGREFGFSFERHTQRRIH